MVMKQLSQQISQMEFPENTVGLMDLLAHNVVESFLLLLIIRTAKPPKSQLIFFISKGSFTQSSFVRDFYNTKLFQLLLRFLIFVVILYIIR